MNKNELEILRRLGEDTAFTFKGLHKEADWLEGKYWLYLVVPGIFSIISLGFEQQLHSQIVRVLAAMSLICLLLALVEQKKLKSVDSYRRLANEIKAVYDRVEEAFLRCNTEASSELREEWDSLRSQTRVHPIGPVGRWQSKRKISEEMNLSWLGEKYIQQ